MAIKFINEVLNKAVRDLIGVSSPSVLAIRAEQGKTIPTQRPLASVRVSMLAPEGWAEKIYSAAVGTGGPFLNSTSIYYNSTTIYWNFGGTTADLDELTSERIRVRATVNYFGNTSTVSSLDEAVALRTFFQTTTALETLAAAGMGFVRTSEVRNLTALENDNYEERAQIDIDLYTVSERLINIFEIQKVQLTGTIEEANDSTDVSTLIS